MVHGAPSRGSRPTCRACPGQQHRIRGAFSLPGVEQPVELGDQVWRLSVGMNCWTNGWPPGSLTASSRRRTPAGCPPAPRPPAPPATGCAATASPRPTAWCGCWPPSGWGCPPPGCAGGAGRTANRNRPERGPDRAASGSTTRPPGRWRYWRRRQGAGIPAPPLDKLLTRSLLEAECAL